ncbi:DNA mismatch repair protein MutT [Paenibacillus montaniterrae]|uniref:DNA mismatch repair protein MutT n=1 Tax=Paenibacillus montaniterrae TaxID=429341 RepID=A0A919YTX5_9BACL|nr:NUDIX domain-containing protein [Paenibacillus montaniterrae]GIP18064.1 DNA mismatch repair protein MutT [Paenibacillus montaniterrae]
MGYIEDIRKLVGNQPLILVRPSAVIINSLGQILLIQYPDHSWGIPGGLMELGESTEECLRREVKEEINLELGELQLFGVFSGKELYTKLVNGHEYYNVIVAYICNSFEGELAPDGVEIIEAQFFHLHEIPESTQPFIKDKLKQFAPQLNQILRE